MRKLPLLIVPVAAIALAGCAMNPLTGNSYNRGQVRSVESITYGTVLGKRSGVIYPSQHGHSWKPTGPQIGAGAGAAVGGIAASALGGGHGNELLTLGGMLAGALVGNHVAQANGKRPAVVLTVRIKTQCSSGTSSWFGHRKQKHQCVKDEAIAQQKSKSTHFHIGERVEVERGGDGTVRVTPAPQGLAQGGGNGS